MLFRQALGEVLREQRLAKSMTLRTVSAKACVALGYLSEVERGQKEASSEIMLSLANGLSMTASDLVFKTGMRMAGLDVPDTIAELPTDEYADLISKN